MSVHLKAALAELDCIGVGIDNHWGPLSIGEFVMDRYHAIRDKLDKHQAEFKVGGTDDWRDAAADAIRENQIIDALVIIHEHSPEAMHYIALLEELARQVNDFVSCYRIADHPARTAFAKIRETALAVKELQRDD